MPQGHPREAKRVFWPVFATATLPTGTSGASSRGEGASIGPLARGPSTEALLGQGRVPKGRESVPLTGLWSGSRPGSARHLRLQVVLSHPRVAKRASIGTSARGLLPKVLQRHPSVAKRGFRPTLRHGDPQQNHLRDGSARRRNLFSNKDY